VKVYVNVAPTTMFPELNDVAPEGTLVDVTVWATVSLLVQVTVLFTPITRVMLSGAKPGAPLGSPEPLGIDTMRALAGALELELEVDVEVVLELELELVLELELELDVEEEEPVPARTLTDPVIQG
jgi:hypothetical protein